MTNKEVISHERLIALVSYDAQTGFFSRTFAKGRGRRKGRRAGSLKPSGYVEVTVDGVGYRAHRLVWFYVTGAWPLDQIDHINGDRSDNRLENLRQCTRSENQQNKAPKVRDLPMGVIKFKKRYLARISLNGVTTRLGMFDTPDLAHAAYVTAKQSMHAFNPALRTRP